MAKKDDEKLYTVDHANKHADRGRTNPNRRIIELMRRGERAPENLAGDAGKITKAPK